MKKRVLWVLVFTFGNSFAQASPPPSRSENFLWRFDVHGSPGKEYGSYCSTKKDLSSPISLCFSEVTRPDLVSPAKGYASVYKDQKVLEKFKIVSSTPWKFLDTADKFPDYTDDVYSRVLTLEDSQGRVSTLKETFMYSAIAEIDSFHHQTLNVSGTLPNGTQVSFDRIYFFYLFD